MKKIILLTVVLTSFFSCSKQIYLKQGSFSLNRDEFRNTKTVSLQQLMIPTKGKKNTDGLTVADVAIEKDVNRPNSLPKFIIKLSIPAETSLTPELYFQVDDTKLQFEFDTITYFSEEKAIYVMSRHREVIHSRTTLKKVATATFSVPTNLANQITNCNNLIVRCYADNTPYQFTFGQHPQYTYESFNPFTLSIFKTTYFYSYNNSEIFPYNLIHLKNFLILKTEEDYLKHYPNRITIE